MPLPGAEANASRPSGQHRQWGRKRVPAHESPPVVEFFRSRREFRRRILEAGLLFSDFSTSPSHIWQAAPMAREQSPLNMTTLSLGLTFTHLSSGLPFDFSLQPGLVTTSASQPEPGGRPEGSPARRLRQDMLRGGLPPRAKGSHGNASQAQKGLRAGHDAAERRPNVDAKAAQGGRSPRPPRAPLSARSSTRFSKRSDQIRFSHALHAPARGSWRSLPSNGGDDFTFAFPRSDTDIYEVLAFGFELLDNAENELAATESLSVYDVHTRLLGVLKLRDLPRPPGESECFYGIVSHRPIGFASFDESADDDEIGLARFAFGYRERTRHVFPAAAWAVAAALILLVLLVEARMLSGLAAVSLGTATLWAMCWAALLVAAAVALWRFSTWSQALLFGLCVCLNGVLSGDNLFVFMLVVEQVRLHRAHHFRAISEGMLLALPVRLLILLCGAALLDHFAWLLTVFGILLLASGLRLCFGFEAPAQPSRFSEHVAEQAQLSPHWSLRCVRAWLPLSWDDATDGSYFAYDDNGRPSATRLVVVVLGVMLSDIFFAMDSTPALLSVTTSPFILVLSLAMSLLALRPAYFMLAAIAEYVDSMQQILGGVLVLIASKILVEAAGHHVQLSQFVAALIGWRICTALFALCKIFCHGKTRPAADDLEAHGQGQALCSASDHSSAQGYHGDDWH